MQGLFEVGGGLGYAMGPAVGGLLYTVSLYITEIIFTTIEYIHLYLLSPCIIAEWLHVTLCVYGLYYTGVHTTDIPAVYTDKYVTQHYLINVDAHIVCRVFDGIILFVLCQSVNQKFSHCGHSSRSQATLSSSSSVRLHKYTQ